MLERKPFLLKGIKTFSIGTKLPGTALVPSLPPSMPSPNDAVAVILDKVMLHMVSQCPWFADNTAALGTLLGEGCHQQHSHCH